MGKHKKDKSHKHKKHSSKHKKKDSKNTSESESDNEIVWSEAGVQPLDAPAEKDKSDEPEPTTQEDDNDWFGLLSQNTSKNVKKADQMRKETKKHSDADQNRLRYSRELNSFFKDQTTKKFIENPDEYWKDRRPQVEEAEEESSSDDDAEESPQPESIPEQSLTDAEKNAINAKIIKAEMMGNTDLVEELKKKLTQTGSNVKVESYVKVKRKEDQNKDMSVKEMFYQTKKINARDEAMRFVAASSKMKNADDEYEDIKSKKKKLKLNPLGDLQRIKEDDDSSCGDCKDKNGNHLLLRLPEQIEHCYATFSPSEPFIKNYCLIKSISHQCNNTLECDEHTWANIRQTMRLVSSFFEQQLNCHTIFMETHFMHQKKAQNLSRKHFAIECVPIKKKYEQDARIFFHKAILECEQEWSINKKLIKLEEKPITCKLPKGLPYFWVSFGPNFNGFAHVIEDENYFRKDFGKEIIGGFHDIEPHKWMKPRYEDYEKQMQRVMQVKNKWNDFVKNC